MQIRGLNVPPEAAIAEKEVCSYAGGILHENQAANFKYIHLFPTAMTTERRFSENLRGHPRVEEQNNDALYNMMKNSRIQVGQYKRKQ